MDISLEDTELQNNILKFGYRINYKYTGTISHSFDRFYVVTKFELPKVQDLQFTIPYDKNRSIGPELTTAKTGPIHLSSLVEIAFVD